MGEVQQMCGRGTAEVWKMCSSISAFLLEMQKRFRKGGENFYKRRGAGEVLERWRRGGGEVEERWRRGGGEDEERGWKNLGGT